MARRLPLDVYKLSATRLVTAMRASIKVALA